ncbi:hypothetical protein [Clostridium sp. DJ247]|uniref:hypothetical protein n=1 Tax=Clostridium sp. DJ247 TaxID=2726188 RepID=UPI00162A58C7|nr:hypothetical protein [Clostridium sp. DJ247]MBC2582596.1 hypothetical protein [Clostridium sp. DJ247]
MKPIVYIKSDISKFYEDGTWIGRIKDRFRMSFLGEKFIKELNLNISSIKFPSNFNKDAYHSNIKIAKKVYKHKYVNLAPKTYRKLDYNFFNSFQKELMAYSVVRSLKLILRIQHKSIKDSCIVIHDAADDINFNVICYMAREAKYIVLLSENIIKANSISQYIIANYGVSPIITADTKYSFKSADFIVTSREINFNSDACIWYLSNKHIPSQGNNIVVNDITYCVPWDVGNFDMSPELLGAILCQMEESDIEQSLKYNGIFLDKIKFNSDVLTLGE